MNLTVFGATGRTGRHVLTNAPLRGHRVTAFTRRPETLADTSALAGVVHGDGRDPDAVAKAVAEADAVIAIVGAATRNGPHHTAEVSRVIVNAMSLAGVRRLIVTSAYPIVADRPRIPMALLRRLLADAYADQKDMERIVTTADLEWTIVRLNRLLDHPARGEVQLSAGQLAKPRPITRADVAATLLNLVENDSHVRTAVNLGGT